MINMLLILLFTTFSLAETHTVNAGSFYYQPSTLTINVNDSVEFINDGGLHDVVVTSGPELLELPACSGPCDIGTLTFTTAGTYDYICSIGSHASNGMVGTIIVEESTASVQVIHNSASPTVDVYIDGALAVEDFEYRAATPVLELGTSFTVGIAPAGEAVIAEFPFNLMDGGEYVVVATGILGNEDTPFDLAATSTTFGASEGNVGLEVYHGSTDAPAVDILADGAVLVPNLSYGSFSGYVEVPAADYVVGVAPTGGASIADFVAPLSGLGSNSAVVFASGFLSGDDPAFGLFYALADGTVLQLGGYDDAPACINDCPSYDLIASDEDLTADEFCQIISSWSDDSCIADCVGDELSEVNDYISLCTDCLANQNCEDILNDDDEECAANVCLTLSDGMLDYTSDTDIAGFQFNHNGCVTSASGGDAEANGFTISSSATAVLGFSFTGSVIPSGMGTLVELEGEVAFDCLSNFVFSDSDGGGLSFEIINDDDIVTETASVQVIHNSASPTVDVYIDGALAVESFEYRAATPVLETSFTVGIAPMKQLLLSFRLI